MLSSGLVYLFAAYLVIWVVLFAYFLYLSQQVSDLRGQLAGLRQRQVSRTPDTRSAGREGS